MSARWPTLLAAALVLCGCGALFDRAALADGPRQARVRPDASLAAKERGYRALLARLHDTPEGIVDYRVPIAPPASADAPLERTPRPLTEPLHGRHADVCFFTGMALGAEALRFAVTGSEDARAAVAHRLAGLEALEAVTGVPGLLARNLSPFPDARFRDEPRFAGARAATADLPFNDKWQRAAPGMPGYVYRGDVSKDQYAGVAFGLGTVLAVCPDPLLRARAGALAARIADRLLAHGLRIAERDGSTTTYGDLRGRILGAPIGVNALISLALVKSAAVGTGEPRFEQAYEELLDDGYPEIARWAHFELLTFYKAINDHMAFLGFYPLLLLEEREPVRKRYLAALEAVFAEVGREQNSFYDLTYVTGWSKATQRARRKRDRELALAVAEARLSLELFPERKVPYPVDLTDRKDLGRKLLNDLDGTPRSVHPIPVHLRPVNSHLWCRGPYDLVGNDKAAGTEAYVGIDYMLAYWMGRHLGVIAPDE